MKDGYALTGAAHADRDHIFDHGVKQWGFAQALTYAEGLNETFNRLVGWSQTGQNRPDLGPHIQVIRYRSHKIYFRSNDDTVRVIRILHVRQLATPINLEQSDAS